MAIEPLNPAPRLQPINDKNGSLNYDWDRFFYNTYSTVNALSSVSASPSMILNGNFHYSASTPVTEADGDGAYTAEKWQIKSDSSATYQIENKYYELNDRFHINSLNYHDIAIDDYDSNDIFLYQQLDGLHYVRMVKEIPITFSASCTNVSGGSVALKFGIYRNYDPDDSLVLSRAVNLSPGENIVAATIDLTQLPSENTFSVGSNPYIQFRVYVTEFIGNCRVKLHYVKVERGRFATPLIIDNALERVRIDNS